jgi:hypothetical protein
MLNAFSRWLYDFMQDLTDGLCGALEPDSNEMLRRWLMNNPEKDISEYPRFLTHTHNGKHTNNATSHLEQND